LTGNNSNVVAGGNAFDAIRAQARNNSTVCARVNSNTTNAGGPGFFGIQLRQANASVFSLEGLTAGPQVDPVARNYVIAQNPGAASVGATMGTLTGVANNSCGITP
jgi:gamma-glutamyltranspeptidase